MTNLKVTNASNNVKRAIGRLVDLLGEDDLATVEAAALALADLGARAVVGPLATRLPRADEVRHRGAIVAVLVTFAPEERAPVVLALRAALGREVDPDLHLVIRKALFAATSGGLFPVMERQRPPIGPIGDEAEHEQDPGNRG